MEAGRKRKAGEGESESSTTSSQVKTRRLSAVVDEEVEEDSGSSVRSESCSCESDGVLASCCSSNVGGDLVEDLVDLEENEVTDNLLSMSAVDTLDSGERRVTTVHSSDGGDDAVAESVSAAETSKCRSALGTKMPTEEEVEKFFASAEKQLHKQFFDKYNYDIEKDSPIQGRFEWVELQL